MAKNKGNEKVNTGFFIRGKIDYSVLLIVIILLIIGLITLISASGPISLNKTGDTYSYVKKQMFFIGAGIVGMFFTSMFNYKFLKRHMLFTYAMYLAVVAMLAYVGLYGKEVKGARRWLEFGGNTLQPSEFAKVILIVFYGIILSKLYESNKIKTLKWGFLYPIVLILPIVFIMFVLQNHLSATIFMVFILAVQMFIAGSRFRYFISTLGLLGSTGYIYYKKFLTGFRKERLDAWLNFEGANTKTVGYQVNQSLYAIASGRLIGLGPGQSIQKYSYLPEAQNDFIFAIFAEEYGFVGCAIIIALFVLLVWKGIAIAINADDMSGMLIASGVTILIGIEAAANFAVVTNTGPVTGVLLPFFSYGGSGMIANLAAVGFLLAVSKNSKKNKGEDI